MEIRIGIASVTKHGARYAGDSYSVVETPDGGAALIVADGHGNTPAAQQTSRWAVQKARSLLLEGQRDEAIARAVHAELYEMKDRKVACALTTLSVDAEAEAAVIGRSGATPVFVWTEEYETVYDDEATLLGMSRKVNPQLYALPLAEGMRFAVVTEGVLHAGRKRGARLDTERIWALLRKNSAEEAEFIAKSILEYAWTLDQEQPADDMTAAVVGVVRGGADAMGGRFFSASCPLRASDA